MKTHHTLYVAWAIFATFCTSTSAQNISAYEDEINSYFSNRLQGTEADLTFNCKLKHKDVASAQEQIWALWRKQVLLNEDEKLLPIAPLSKEKVGKWTLPSHLEQNAVMPFYWGTNHKNEVDYTLLSEYPLFLYLHGSGDKNREWATGYELCKNHFYAPAIYMVPQIPNGYGELYRWATPAKQWAWEKMLRLALVNDTIDANRIYFFGISEGGYGSQRLASFYADYLAGAGPMAGGEPIKNAPMENVSNIAFSLRTGEKDYGFGRNLMTQTAHQIADSLQALHPTLYNHYIELIPERGHGIDYTPTTPWLAKHTRNPHPKYFHWENYDMYGRVRNAFYNIKVNKDSKDTPEQRTCYEMCIEGNTVHLNIKNVTYKCTYASSGIEFLFAKEYTESTHGHLTLYLNHHLVNLQKRVIIIVNGTTVYNNKVKANLQNIVESCALFYDPERLFPCAVDIDIAKAYLH